MPREHHNNDRRRHDRRDNRDRRPQGNKSREGGYRSNETPRRGKSGKAKRDRMLIAGFDNDRSLPDRNYQSMNAQQLETRREQEYQQQVSVF